MRCDYLIKAMGCIDSALVDEAEDYKPARKNHAWIWAAASAASAVCLLIIVFVTFSKHEDVYDPYVTSTLSSESSDYRENVENANVVMSNEDFNVVMSGEDFTEESDDSNVLFSGGEIIVTEEYLKTVDGTLNVWVFTNSGVDEALAGYEGEERIRICKQHIEEFFADYAEDHGLNREEFEYFGIFTGTFIAELDTEQIAELLADKRTALISVYTETGYFTDF